MLGHRLHISLSTHINRAVPGVGQVRQQARHRLARRLHAAQSGSGPPAATPAAAAPGSGAPPDRQPPPFASTSGRGEEGEQLATLEDVRAAAASRGLCIRLTTLGPFYRITCREGDEQGKVVAIVNGFVAPPFGIAHIDTMQIFTRGLKGEEGDRLRGGALGLGLLMGGAVFGYAHSQGCSKAEILAINDDEYTHARLVKYYSYFGFKPVCSVGDQGFFKDLPHLLVWGGEGTRMDADIAAMLRRWTPALRKQAAAGGAAAGGAQQAQ